MCKSRLKRVSLTEITHANIQHFTTVLYCKMRFGSWDFRYLHDDQHEHQKVNQRESNRNPHTIGGFVRRFGQYTKMCKDVGCFAYFLASYDCFFLALILRGFLVFSINRIYTGENLTDSDQFCVSLGERDREIETTTG